MRTPVRDVLLDSQEDAWVRVGDGWLTGRAQPESKEELKSWGRRCRGESAVYWRRRWHCAWDRRGGCISPRVGVSLRVPSPPLHLEKAISVEDCTELARAVVAIDAHLQRGHKVVVQCRHGQRRTAMAIYVVLLLNVVTHADCLPMMKTMRRAMHVEVGKRSKFKDLFVKTQCALTNPVFIRDYAYELKVFCI